MNNLTRIKYHKNLKSTTINITQNNNNQHNIPARNTYINTSKISFDHKSITITIIHYIPARNGHINTITFNLGFLPVDHMSRSGGRGCLRSRKWGDVFSFHTRICRQAKDFSRLTLAFRSSTQKTPYAYVPTRTSLQLLIIEERSTQIEDTHVPVRKIEFSDPKSKNHHTCNSSSGVYPNSNWERWIVPDFTSFSQMDAYSLAQCWSRSRASVMK